MSGFARRAALAAVVTLGFGMAGPAQAEKTTLVVAMSAADAGRLDPHLTSTHVDKVLLNWLFNGLVRIRPGEASPAYIEPDLAESWDSNEDATVWTFKLREGVQCHHGYGELTSEDVVYSIERAADGNRSSFSGDFSAIDDVTAVDRYTVRVALKAPVPSLLGILTNYHGGNIVCKRAAEELGENFATRPIGTGPFMFDEYKSQQYTRLVAHEGYFRGAPQIKEIVYRYIPSDAARDLAFEAGEVDMIYGKQDASWIQRIQALPGAVIAVMEPTELSTIYLNMSSEPLDDIRVRRAIAHAIDRKALAQLKGGETNRPAQSVIPVANLGFSPVPLAEHDIGKAKALLAEAGFADGVTVKAIQSTLPVLMSIMEGVQAQLREAGINLEIIPVEHATYHSQIRDDLSQIVLYQAARFPVADVYLTNFYHSASTVGTATAITNFSHCDVADADIEAARSETDIEKQKALWTRAQERIGEAVCGVPLIETLQLYAYSDKLQLGYDLNGSLNLGPPITEKSHFVD